METKNLKLISYMPGDLLALIESEELYEKRTGLKPAAGLRDFFGYASPTFLALLQSAQESDPWTFGFALVHKEENILIGTSGYKGPPGIERQVEIAYGIAPGYQGRGYATEAAQALVEYAFASGNVTLVCAHTLPETNASTSVLTKCGFTKVSEVNGPEDGLIWRWEKRF